VKKKRYSYLFGPVPSRRLGISLGVDLVPYKVCSLDCVYCECGATTAMTAERKEYVPTSEVIRELDDYLSGGPELNYITFSGSGEPTLHSGMGEVVRFIKGSYPAYSIALLTNGTLFSQPGVIDEILEIDLVVPSVDAVTEPVFQAINKPGGVVAVADYVSGLLQFGAMYKGETWVEIFVIPGFNDTLDELEKIRDIVTQMHPAKVQLNHLDRPGTQSWVTVPARENLEWIAEQLKPLQVEIVGRFVAGHHTTESTQSELNERIMNLLMRRPCTIDDLVHGIGLSPDFLTTLMADLVANGLVISRQLDRGVFYSIRK
jgi:wyosine [tRNA(Phe)-imidazoG37] synthetase (radical SAM superfamily)